MNPIELAGGGRAEDVCSLHSGAGAVCSLQFLASPAQSKKGRHVSDVQNGEGNFKEVA